MSDTNPKLSNSPLLEAVMEIRFKPEIDLTLLVGALSQDLQSYKFENLNIPNLPFDDPNLNNVIRYRFISENDMISLGNGVLVVTTKNYTGYENYIKNFTEVFKKHKLYSKSDNISRVGIRYLNLIERNNIELKKIFKYEIILPPSVDAIQKGFGYTSNGTSGNNNITSRLYTSEEFSDEKIMLDIDFYSHESRNYDIDELIIWLNEAHSEIYRIFKDSLTEEYFNKIK